jgi:excisionase family DNA binding protein
MEIIMATKLLKVTDVANVLNISRSKAYSMLDQGDIPSIRMGKLRRVHPEVLNQFIIDNQSDNNGSLRDSQYLFTQSKLVNIDTNFSSEKEINHV